MSATHVVVRAFDGPNGRLSPGAEVSASGWRNVDALVRRRYLREKSQAETSQAQTPQGPAPTKPLKGR